MRGDKETIVAKVRITNCSMTHTDFIYLNNRILAIVDPVISYCKLVF